LLRVKRYGAAGTTSRLARTPLANEPWFGERVMPEQLPSFR
jgi:hypothetical protein